MGFEAKCAAVFWSAAKKLLRWKTSVILGGKLAEGWWYLGGAPIWDLAYFGPGWKCSTWNNSHFGPHSLNCSTWNIWRCRLIDSRFRLFFDWASRLRWTKGTAERLWTSGEDGRASL